MDDEADTKAEVGNSSFAYVEVVFAFENGCEDCEEEVEVAIDYEHINSKENNRGGGESLL